MDARDGQAKLRRDSAWRPSSRADKGSAPGRPPFAGRGLPCNLSAAAVLAWVNLPEAACNALPDLVCNSIAASIAGLVSFPELLHAADMARALTFHSSRVVLAAAPYVAALWPLVRLVSRLERGNPSR